MGKNKDAKPKNTKKAIPKNYPYPRLFLEGGPDKINLCGEANIGVYLPDSPVSDIVLKLLLT